MNFVMPVKRNSLIYNNTSMKEYDFFEYRGRLVKFGKFRYDHQGLRYGCVVIPFRRQSVSDAEKMRVQ